MIDALFYSVLCSVVTGSVVSDSRPPGMAAGQGRQPVVNMGQTARPASGTIGVLLRQGRLNWAVAAPAVVAADQ